MQNRLKNVGAEGDPVHKNLARAVGVDTGGQGVDGEGCEGMKVITLKVPGIRNIATYLYWA